MAKIAVKKGKIQPSSDVLLRHLQGSQFTPHNMRRASGGSKKKGLGKKKLHTLKRDDGVKFVNRKGEVQL